MRDTKNKNEGVGPGYYNINVDPIKKK